MGTTDDPFRSKSLVLPFGQLHTRSHRFCQVHHGRDCIPLYRLPVMARSTHYQVSILLAEANALKRLRYHLRGLHYLH
jgi:hypothetical protein